MNVRTALAQGAKLLDESAVPAPRLTAEVLLSFALRRNRTYLYTHPEDELSEVAWIHYGRYLHQRMQGKPTQYITKTQEFYGRSFFVCPDVLIPRPETEHAVSAALERLTPGATFVDVGCGSGAIAITLALEAPVHAMATDISEAALRVARRNAAALGARISCAACDLTTALKGRSVDLLVSNPPYVGLHEADGLQREVREHEPHLALFGGAQGTEIYERLITDAARVLRPGGWIVLELGWKSLETVQAFLGPQWHDIHSDYDLAGIPRVLSARLRP
jgi:release factor glutamine methyltransferase